MAGGRPPRRVHDHATGERGREPLRTLATYRLLDGKVLFGQNLIHDGTGTIRVGDDCVVALLPPLTSGDSGR
ncbi:MAG: hypothetical protein C3F15_04000 [Holophagae bacterium]|nr:MAG: hypothetical protein C3F15_04000 [Holophagae bacterium]